MGLITTASLLPHCSDPAQGCRCGTPIALAMSTPRGDTGARSNRGRQDGDICLHPGPAPHPSAVRTVLVLGQTRGWDVIIWIYQPEPGCPSPPTDPPQAPHTTVVQPHVLNYFFSKDFEPGHYFWLGPSSRWGLWGSFSRAAARDPNSEAIWGFVFFFRAGWLGGRATGCAGLRAPSLGPPAHCGAMVSYGALWGRWVGMSLPS